jgi:hypothetical protein
MALEAKQNMIFGLKKEDPRGTPETGPDTWYPVLGDSALTYQIGQLENETIRGLMARQPSKQGRSNGTGTISLILDPQTCVEFFNSLLGDITSTLNVANSYTHTLLQDNALLKPSYTMWLKYGALETRRYSQCQVKKITINGPVDGFLTLNAEIMFKSEDTGGSGIGTPSFPAAPQLLSFQHVDFKIGGSSNADVKNFTLNIDNGLIAQQVLSQSKDPAEMLAAGPMTIDGSFTMFFSSVSERGNFLSDTERALQALIEAGVVETGHNWGVDVNLYHCKYRSFPYGDEDGLFAAQVEFGGFYSDSDSKAIQIDIKNKTATY